MHWGLPYDMQAEKNPSTLFFVILPGTTNAFYVPRSKKVFKGGILSKEDILSYLKRANVWFSTCHTITP